MYLRMCTFPRLGSRLKVMSRRSLSIRQKSAAVRARRIATATASLLLAVRPAHGQSRWQVTSSPAADRWFAAMAQLDLPVPGTLTFYRRSTQPPPAWRAQAARARALEVLHFVPLYYPSATPAALTAAVRAAANGQAAHTPRASFLVGALQRTVTATDERQLLAFVAALADSAVHGDAVPDAQLAALQAAWDSVYAPALAPFLVARRLVGGALLVSPALGAEGRIFEGRPGDPLDNVIAVGAARESGLIEAPLLEAVRESCAPLITELSADRRAWRDDPVSASQASVRCGLALVDRALPARAEAYRTLWARHAGAARFADAFPPNAREDTAIRAAIQSAFASRDVR